MKKTLRIQFGERVKELRIATGMSQEAFADRCGFARSYMSVLNVVALMRLLMRLRCWLTL
jgi:ribosome-binding protein aMBF1 (putative translation factor)